MKAPSYLLDTNIASHIIKGDMACVLARLAEVPMGRVSVSVITEAELRHGVAKRGHPPGLALRVEEFLVRVDILPWTSAVARAHAELRAACEAAGVPLAALDMMIAAQAHASGAILVTRDRAFSRLPYGLPLEDWTRPD